jgi:hypothetical protein
MLGSMLSAVGGCRQATASWELSRVPEVQESQQRRTLPLNCEARPEALIASVSAAPVQFNQVALGTAIVTLSQTDSLTASERTMTELGETDMLRRHRIERASQAGPAR